jgi:hypothetical protein
LVAEDILSLPKLNVVEDILSLLSGLHSGGYAVIIVMTQLWRIFCYNYNDSKVKDILSSLSGLGSGGYSVTVRT